MASEIGSALIQLGEPHGQGTFIGIYAINSAEVSVVVGERTLSATFASARDSGCARRWHVISTA